MKIENDKIIQATEDELYSYWLSRDLDDVYSFPEYMQRMKEAGCEVIAEIPPPTLFETITVSPEVLAKSSVYRVRDNGMPGEWWTSPFIDNERYASRGEAYVATVEKLKEARADG